MNVVSIDSPVPTSLERTDSNLTNNNKISDSHADDAADSARDEAAPTSPLDFLQNVDEVMERMRNMSSSIQDLTESYRTVVRFRRIITNSRLKLKKGQAFLEVFDYLVEKQWPSLLTDVSNAIIEHYSEVFSTATPENNKFPPMTTKVVEIPNLTKEEAVALIWVKLSVSALSLTDIHSPSMEAAGPQGLIKHYLVDVLPKLEDAPDPKTLRGKILDMAVTCLYNCTRVSSNRYYFNLNDGIGKLMKLKAKSSGKISMFCLFALAYLIDEQNNHLIISGTEPIDLFVKYINGALKNPKRRYAGASLGELAAGVTQVAVNDQNKRLIGERGGVEAIINILQTAKDDEERSTACQALWMLSFDETNREMIKKHSEALKLLKINQSHFNVEVRKAAAGALWELEGKDLQVGRAQSRAGETSEADTSKEGHVMISYQWDVQSLVKEIKEFLINNGFQVWMDIDQIGGSTLQAMAAAVENANVVLICFSSKYKESPNCRSEAEYAFQLRKEIIPLRVERRYQPDGWLGLVIGAKFYIDYGELRKEQCNRSLMKELTRAGTVSQDTFKEITLAPIESSPGTIPETPKQTNKGVEVSKWTNEEVKMWLHSNALDTQIKHNITMELTGRHLVLLHQLRFESPQFFYTSVQESFGFTNVLYLLDFVDALKTLLN